MTNSQKIIKYFAYALAALIIFSVISFIVSLAGTLVNSFDVSDDASSNSFRKVLNNNYNNITRLEIEVSRVNLTIENGNKFNIETSNKYISSRVKDKTLYIDEKNHSIFKRDKGSVIITIPSDKEFEFVSIEAGAASIGIDEVNTNILMLNLGAGTTVINNLVVSSRADIDGGAGNIEIKASTINNLDLDMGVGNLVINSNLTGDSKIDSGIGNLTLNLNKSLEDYTFTFDKGIGNIKINGENVKNVNLPNTGDDKIHIDGGIGNTSITTIDNKEEANLT